MPVFSPSILLGVLPIEQSQKHDTHARAAFLSLFLQFLNRVAQVAASFTLAHNSAMSKNTQHAGRTAVLA